MRKIKAEDLLDTINNIKSDVAQIRESLLHFKSDYNSDAVYNNIKMFKIKKSIDLLLQEANLNPDEWEYKFDTKLTRKETK